MLDQMEKFSAFTSNIWGADKMYKITMYTARLLNLGLGKAQDSDALQQADVRVQLAAFALQSLTGKVADNISAARYILRFFGVVDWTVRFARNPYSWAEQPAHAALHQASAACMLLFHPADHAVWLGKAAPDIVPGRTVQRLQRFGTRAANVFLLCQFLLKLLHLRGLLLARRQLHGALQRLQSTTTSTSVPAAAADGSSSSAASAPPASSSPSAQKRPAQCPASVDSSMDSEGFAGMSPPPSPPSARRSQLQAHHQAVQGVQRQVAAADAQVASALQSLLRYALDWLVTLHFSLPRGIGLSPAATSSMGLLSTLLAAGQQWAALQP